MTSRQWLDSVKKEHESHKTSEFYYGEGGTNGLLVFDGNQVTKMICRVASGEVLVLDGRGAHGGTNEPSPLR